MEFWTALTAIATAIAALAAGFAAIRAGQLLGETRRQVEVEIQQVTEAQKQVAISQQQVEVTQRQIKAQYLPILELRLRGGSNTDQVLVNVGNGIARNIDISFPAKPYTVRLNVNLSPKDFSIESIQNFRASMPMPVDGEQVVIRYKDVLGYEYIDLYRYAATIPHPRWVPDVE